MLPGDSLWALLPEAAPSVFVDIHACFQANQPHPQLPVAALSSVPESGDSGYEIQDGVALIAISGPVTRRAVFSSWSGKPLTQGQDSIALALDKAASDPRVHAILLSINSPGGVVAGTKELADRIAEVAGKKPMAAYADGLMASAAMWLGAATGRIFAPVTATMGSIGVIMMHADYSRQNERWGVRYSYITGGKLKAAGNEDEPLSDEARALFQKQVTEIHEIFKADVARGLGVTAPAENWAEGQTMLAGEAHSLGLVTHIVRDLSSAIQLLKKEANMDFQTFAAQHPDLLAEITARAQADALAEHEARAKTQPGMEDVLAMVRILAGEAVAAKLHDLVQAKVTPEQLALMADLLGGTETPQAKPEEDGKAQVLAALQTAHSAPVVGSMPPEGTRPSRLLADAEKRAEQAKRKE